MFLLVLLIRLRVVLIIDLATKIVLYRRKNAVNKFINQFLTNRTIVEK